MWKEIHILEYRKILCCLYLNSPKESQFRDFQRRSEWFYIYILVFPQHIYTETKEEEPPVTVWRRDPSAQGLVQSPESSIRMQSPSDTHTSHRTNKWGSLCRTALLIIERWAEPQQKHHLPSVQPTVFASGGRHWTSSGKHLDHDLSSGAQRQIKGRHLMRGAPTASLLLHFQVTAHRTGYTVQLF